MLSDTCFQCMDDLLEAVVSYDYSDDYKKQLIHIIRKLNEIKDDLDRCSEGPNRLIKNKRVSKRIAKKMFDLAVQKRQMSSIDFFAP